MSTGSYDAFLGTTPRVATASDVRNMNMDKAVATRLHRMLAVSELEASSVKSDSASYAKMNLLTQQAHLLRQQAVQTVNKSASRKSDDVQLTNDCTALSEYDSGAKRLLSLLNVNEKAAEQIRRDKPAAAKLSLLADQVDLLQGQAQQVLDAAELNRKLTEIARANVVRIVPGTTYYHYTQHGKDVISRISNTEWTSYDVFHGKYLYDYDFAFREVFDEVDGVFMDDEFGPGGGLALLPHIVETPAAPMQVEVPAPAAPAPEPFVSEPAAKAPAPAYTHATTPVLCRW